MSKESKNMIVPKLRFPEFKKDGEWKEKKLGDCLLAHPDYGINAPAVPYSSHLPTYLRITDISEEGHFLARNKVSVEKEVSENNYLQRGDIVIARTGASVGKSYKYRTEDGELVFAGFLIRVRPDENKLNAELLFQYLSSQKYWSWVSFTSMRSGQPGINGNEYASLPIPLPKSLPEQQKIASCLSSLDDLITAENQKLEALKAHKKGLMQQLFPAEGEIMPKLRFAEFRGSGKWEEKKLIDVADKSVKWSFTGGPFGSNLKASDYVERGIRVIQLQNIGDGEFLDSYKIFTSLEKADELLSCNIYPGEIILSKMGDPVGRACFIPETNSRYVMCSDGIRLVVNESLYNKYFVFTLINSIPFRTSVEKTATGSTRKRIGLDDLKNLPMMIPPNLKEQQKIASCLSSLDELITSQAEKIEALKEHKKGLMQGLFPAQQ